jgi:perosamine synthetase
VRRSTPTSCNDLAGRAGIAVVEDAAHACGSTYRGAPIGSHPGTQNVFSFQATKNLTAVDGGMICSGPPTTPPARRLRWMGIDQDTWTRTASSTYRWAYDVDEVGHRYSMNDLNAAIGLAHLPLLPAANARRCAIAERYRRALAGLEAVTIVDPPADRTSATYLAAILVDRRDDAVERLGRAGIETGVHYRRNDHHPLFGEPRDLPGAQAYWTRTLSLPLHLELTDEEVDAVIDAVRQAVTPG